ncbi:DUF2500 domain-containing protein [Atlantibacter sp. RC6]|uniref:DUF2500 domain-containing protein n=1 Tax=Atlantibacter sp. RC6 TaxID=2587036 RepID=UPI001606AB08|nr:DUF2500 domain-containing protein [Atlantibacter sp. RC6]MBB3322755.1 hypothetical protein [Atlantibacter sp. RC6]
MSKIPLFLIVIIGLIVISASFRYVQQRRENASNEAAPQRQKQVEISSKREKPANDRRSRQRDVTPAGETMRYEASFTPLQGGMEMTFRLQAADYHQLTVGEKGVLVYQGTRFVRFDAQP